jgi:hypothetical protein
MGKIMHELQIKEFDKLINRQDFQIFKQIRDPVRYGNATAPDGDTDAGIRMLAAQPRCRYPAMDLGVVLVTLCTPVALHKTIHDFKGLSMAMEGAHEWYKSICLVFVYTSAFWFIVIQNIFFYLISA